MGRFSRKRGPWMITVLGLILSPILALTSDIDAPESEPPTGFSGVVRSAYAGGPLLPDAVVRFEPMEVDASHAARGILVSDASGAFGVRQIEPGLYALRIQAQGHISRDDTSVVVVEQAVTVLDVKLRPMPPPPEEPAQDMSYIIVMQVVVVVLLVVMYRGNLRIRRMREERESKERWEPRTFPSSRPKDHPDE